MNEPDKPEPEVEEKIDPARLPYPWCIGAPTKRDCLDKGYCRRDPNCGE